MRLMANRDDPRFLGFWRMQVMGWTAFYLLVLLAVLPYRSQEQLRAQTIGCAAMFLASCSLHPVCRSLQGQSLSWMAREFRALLWSAAAGAAASFLAELAIVRVVRLVWVDLLFNYVQFTVVLFLWCTLYFGVKQWQQSVQERERLLRAENDVREARLTALRYQLNPHFLFNSLNAVSTLVLDGDAHRATSMLAQISDLLRTSLECEAPSEIPLSQEIALTELYLTIERTRLGERLQVHFAIPPEALDALVPSMVLQPLVENAVRHGVAALVEGGRIAISAGLAGGRLRIVLRNQSPRGPRQGEPAGGIGLHNTRERLRALYGANQILSLTWPEAGVCEVTLELPFRRALEGKEVPVCAH